MAVVAKEDSSKPFITQDDEEDALLNEAICCSRNLEIKTDDDEEEEEVKNKQKKAEDTEKQKRVSKAWCDMDSDSSSLSNLSTSNGKIDLSTSGGKIDLSSSNIIFETDVKSENNVNAENTETNEPEHISHTNDSGNSSPVRKRLREGEDNSNSESKMIRNRLNSNSSSSTLSGHSRKNVEYESDPNVLARRQKDIDYGKNTIGYDRYTREIPKDKRTKDHPRTPPMYMKYSRRGWDGMVKLWRKQLHFWDPVEENQKTTDKTENVEEKKENEIKEEELNEDELKEDNQDWEFDQLA